MSAVLAKPQVKDFLKTLAKGKEKGQEQRKEHDVNAHAATAEGEPSKKPWEEDIPELSSPSYSPPTSFSYSSDSSSSSNPRRRGVSPKRVSTTRANSKKGTFGVQEVSYIGFIISSDGIGMDLVKSQFILEISKPRNRFSLSWVFVRLGSMITNGKGTLSTAGIVQVLDVGCGVGSFSAYLSLLGINTMSFAPKDEHENQLQFALERGILAMLSVLAIKRLPYPSKSFDMVHCSRCRVDWHKFDGILLKEVDRVLRPEGYFIYSAPPAYRSDKDFPQEWKLILDFATAMCWELVAREVQTAIWRKKSHETCQANYAQNQSFLCSEEDDPDKPWNKPMQNCIYRSLHPSQAESEKLPPWPARLWVASQRLGGLGGTLDQFNADSAFWKEQVVYYWSLLDVPDSYFRNVMDMNAYYGGFAAALAGKPSWVMNVVPSTGKNTLPIIYDRGLIGIFHDWCEPFSTYPRTYDLLHAFRVLSAKRKGCQMKDILLEMDRMLRPLVKSFFFSDKKFQLFFPRAARKSCHSSDNINGSSLERQNW
ncbi:hypothetical protein L7F22_033181 [Adiantum nelumboides]|nr:hypothetical protein [Adiantum nelumboides]